MDILARRALWKDGLNYLVRISLRYIREKLTFRQHGSGHGFGSFLNVCLKVYVMSDSHSIGQVHEGPQELGAGNNVILRPGHVLTNEPGFCESILWGHIKD